MPMRSDWVDALFARLSVRYGVEFSRRYADVDMPAVKADWAEALDGFSGATVSAALRHLPTDRAPNAGQFAELCRVHAVGRQDTAALPAPSLSPEDLRRQAEALRGAATAVKAAASTGRARAIERLQERIAQGGATAFQRFALRRMQEADSGSGEALLSSGSQIPEHLLPPGMRNNGIVLDHCRDLIARAALGEYVPPDRLALAQSMLRRSEARKEAQRQTEAA